MVSWQQQQLLRARVARESGGWGTDADGKLGIDI
jgi:hypothetical protein